MTKKLQVLQNEEVISPLNIKTITNSNGTAIQFPDGTMLATGRNIPIYVSITNQLNSTGGMYYGYVDAGWATYPATFIEPPVCNVYITSVSNVAFLQMKDDGTDSQLPGFYPYSSKVSEWGTKVSYMAIGRWKSGGGLDS